MLISRPKPTNGCSADWRRLRWSGLLYIPSALNHTLFFRPTSIEFETACNSLFYLYKYKPICFKINYRNQTYSKWQFTYKYIFSSNSLLSYLLLSSHPFSLLFPPSTYILLVFFRHSYLHSHYYNFAFSGFSQSLYTKRGTESPVNCDYFLPNPFKLAITYHFLSSYSQRYVAWCISVIK
jgi:hypothetical protein